MNWGVIQERDDTGDVVGFHVVPLYLEAGEESIADEHEIGAGCFCNPERSDDRPDGIPVYSHHAPNHPGSNERVQ